MREVSKMSFSCEERRLGWLSELLERASEEVTKDRTSGVRTVLVQFRTARHSLRICHPRKRASAKFKRVSDRGKISDGGGALIGDWNWV
jgi:hypothetical protein